MKDAFGLKVSESDAAITHLYGYTGREYNEVTKLQYNRARYYDPKLGRWINDDPKGFDAGDANLYRYVGNAPTNGTDPSGLDEEGGLMHLNLDPTKEEVEAANQQRLVELSSEMLVMDAILIEQMANLERLGLETTLGLRPQDGAKYGVEELRLIEGFDKYFTWEWMRFQHVMKIMQIGTKKANHMMPKCNYRGI